MFLISLLVILYWRGPGSGELRPSVLTHGSPDTSKEPAAETSESRQSDKDGSVVPGPFPPA